MNILKSQKEAWDFKMKCQRIRDNYPGTLVKAPKYVKKKAHGRGMNKRRLGGGFKSMSASAK